MTESLRRKRSGLLEEIAQIQHLRRGQLSEQYYKKTDAKGRKTRQGPYYVWQAWIKGNKRSVRIGRDDVGQVRKEVEAYQRYRDLCEQLADVTEEMTCTNKQDNAKKKPRKRAKPSTKS